MQMRDGTDGTPPPITILIEEDMLDRRPTVLRAGKLPKELPKWFAELDGDKDGQVALHEWRRGGKNIDEFKDWDRNDDGFVTAEEVLGKMRVDSIALAGNATPSLSEDGTPIAQDDMRGGFGGFGKKGNRDFGGAPGGGGPGGGRFGGGAPGGDTKGGGGPGSGRMGKKGDRGNQN